MSQSLIYRLLWVVQLVCFLAMVWPVATLANHIEPYVLGLPFLFFWYVLWIFIMFVGLIGLYYMEGKGET